MSPDDEIIKVFRLKRLFSSALLFPYALRFAENAARLHRLGFQSVVVRSIFRLRARRQHLVVYPRLPGETLRAAIVAGHDSEGLLGKLGPYLARLHESGVYFRAVHFGNVLVADPAPFALIDVTDLRFKDKPLSLRERVRNFGHLTRYAEDRSAFKRFGPERFVDGYLQTARFDSQRAQRLGVWLNSLLK